MNPSTDNSATLVWRKARKSLDNGQCVELSASDGQVLVRDSKHPERGYLAYTREEWNAFLDGAKKGEFDDLL